MARISAHRGGGEHTRPATYEAYQNAVASGAEYAEFDIRRTRDGVLVVHHDPRAGDGGRPVGQLSYREFCGVAGYEVPRVGEVMTLLAGEVRGHLDLKETGYEAEVITLALAILGAGNFVVTTLEDVSVATIKKAFPGVTTALSLGRGLDGVPPHRQALVRYSELFPLPRLRACQADWVALNHKLARFGTLATCQRAGLGTMVWTVDADPLIDRYLADPRVNVLITNRPRHAVRRREELADGRAHRR